MHHARLIEALVDHVPLGGAGRRLLISHRVPDRKRPECGLHPAEPCKEPPSSAPAFSSVCAHRGRPPSRWGRQRGGTATPTVRRRPTVASHAVHNRAVDSIHPRSGRLPGCLSKHHADEGSIPQQPLHPDAADPGFGGERLEIEPKVDLIPAVALGGNEPVLRHHPAAGSSVRSVGPAGHALLAGSRPLMHARTCLWLL